MKEEKALREIIENLLETLCGDKKTSAITSHGWKSLARRGEWTRLKRWMKAYIERFPDRAIAEAY
jgi:hypothetical protein